MTTEPATIHIEFGSKPVIRLYVSTHDQLNAAAVLFNLTLPEPVVRWYYGRKYIALFNCLDRGLYLSLVNDEPDFPFPIPETEVPK